MTKETADLLVECGEECNADVELYGEYSGRNMYGKTTTGVVVSSMSDLLKLVAYAGYRMGCDPNTTEKQVLEGFRNLKTDTMGYQIIVY